ncbi:leucine-rich repeat receptor-like tyrosine-protein kinase PXC3 isoform X2 [Durio zibethinus]|uniref:Leucine-rich repeat receptor-like tyrosine-protein kinase PXC3 isoform X2 n=1 Tax=Durio zibethinus TaxID=66656 RepID=A0A6P6B910_DURZI|nr:leucine-rich repeat receptor-like tyrosine-protein kinase PXC3 isoform X2 [Durio zibethinus]
MVFHTANMRSCIHSIYLLLNISNSPWNAAKEPNVCQWKGVTCNSTLNNSVVSLSLSGFGLSNSSFLPMLCHIDSLQSLDFSNNSLTSIPIEFFNSCGGIDELKSLNFSNNMLVGSLPTFQKFPGLESLDLSFNHLSGNIDSQLNDLSALKNLNLIFNNFNGSVPSRLGKSRVLERLELSVNNFTGSIPMDIGTYGNLILIDLSRNMLTGVIPESVGNLTRLQILILSSNQLNGAIPVGLSRITKLQRFAANQNKFVGSIPSNITKFLKNLDLSYNEITGEIPSEFLLPSNLHTVDLSYNKLHGPIPESISPSLVRLRLGSNNLSGPISSVRFASLQNLMYLELENNTFTGMIPTEIGSCTKLALLNLAHNELNGTLPVELGHLTNLQVLKLQLNKLGGDIPGQIGGLNILSILNISWNSLNGTIPSSISNCGKLLSLNLQGNDLTGSIPDNISKLNYLLELQLGENKLRGRIPSMPLKLQISLNLSSNLFEGPIPRTLSGLNNLEVLDLSNNNFSGEVPDFLAQLSSLTLLILSNNQLSGVLPMFNQHVSVNKSGNPELRPAESSSPVSSKNRKSVAMTIVITLAAAVLAVGVVAIIFLLISRRFHKVNDNQLQSWEVLSPPQVIRGNLLTANGIHKSNIDIAKAMEVIASPANIVLKTRFSTYYKAIMPSGASYFVKKLNWSDKIFQLGSHDKFVQELEVLGNLSNSNVMIPLAYVLTVDSAYLFYEFAPKGTLHDILHGSLKYSLDWASRYSIAVGVAQGLAFLHGCTSSPILLLDLSSRSIVLKSLKEPQVGDIELFKVINPSKSTGSLSTVAGSVGYIPPEYAYTMRVTMAGNIYSFGVVLLELLTGKPAVSEGTELAKWVLSNSVRPDKLDHILDFNIIRTSLVVRNQMLAVLKVAIACISVSPEARPKMKSVLRMILNAR